MKTRETEKAGARVRARGGTAGRAAPSAEFAHACAPTGEAHQWAGLHRVGGTSLVN